MGKWIAGGANKITLGRVPCMLLVLYAVFYRGRDHVGWYWLGALALTIGMILDALDGYWARNMSKPTTEGQFLDQFIDKWGFVYPIFFALSLIMLEELWMGWHPLLLVMLALDVRSCYKHYLKYRVAHKTGQFDPSAGANLFGKVKFAIQNVAICVMVASLCPPVVESSWPLLAWCSNFIGWLGRTLFAAAYVGLAAAIVLALISLNKRGNGGWRRIVREVVTTPL